jgi:hypothetical protein
MTKHFRALLIATAALLATGGLAMMRANDSIEQQLLQQLATKGDAP